MWDTSRLHLLDIAHIGALAIFLSIHIPVVCSSAESGHDGEGEPGVSLSPVRLVGAQVGHLIVSNTVK